MKVNRPKTFNEFQGLSNKETVDRLKIAVSAAKKRQEAMSHVLLYGNAGLGKSTLGYIIANEMGLQLKTITGGTLKKPKDLLLLLWDIWGAQKRGSNKVLFIDEIHVLAKSNDISEETYYPILEDYIYYHNLEGIDLKIGGREFTVTGGNAALQPFTIIGATTAPGYLSKPLRDRFPIACFLKEYTKEDIRDVIKRYAIAERIQYADDALLEIAQRARGNPRVGINFFRGAYDLITSRDELIVTKEAVLREMQLQHVDGQGLTEADLKILTTLARNPKGLGLNNLSGCAGIEKSTIEELYEPFLKVCGYMETRHKRFISNKGIELLKKKKILN